MMAYAGFDRADCPDLAAMANLFGESNLRWGCYYLRAPSQAASTWRGKRAALVAQGWGLAPVYVGQQVEGPGSHHATPAQATIDGDQAAADMAAEGFPVGSWVYLDLESWPFPLDYVREWAIAVEAAGYRAGVYCSFMFAGQVAAALPSARIWVYHVPRVDRHPVGGTSFPAPDPATSGYERAVIWQLDDSAVLTEFDSLLVDLDTSAYADPGAPDGAAPPVAAPAAIPTDPIELAKWAQRELAARGLYAGAIDGEWGPLSQHALRMLEISHGLTVDSGILGPETIKALAS